MVYPHLTSFCLETVLFRHGGVNLLACLCGVDIYASAQPLDFLATTKNPSFPIQKRFFSAMAASIFWLACAA
jgi:hypothetical protein